MSFTILLIPGFYVLALYAQYIQENIYMLCSSLFTQTEQKHSQLQFRRMLDHSLFIKNAECGQTTVSNCQANLAYRLTEVALWLNCQLNYK